MPKFMLPEIREAYRQALAELRAAGKEAKPLYHQVREAESVPSILTRGPQTSVSTEPWKPPAFYASDNLDENMASTLGDIFPGEKRKAIKEGRILRVVPKPDATTSQIPEYDLIDSYERGIDPKSLPESKADILKIPDADNRSSLSEYLIRNPRAVRIFSKDKAWLPMLAGAIGASVLGTPDSSDAVMLPEVRKLMNAMKAQGGKTLFHDTWNPRGMLESGISDPKLTSSMKESHKPLALYATDQLKKIPGHLSFAYKDTDTTKALRARIAENWKFRDLSPAEGGTDSRIARIVLKPDANVREIPEEFMHTYNIQLAKVRRDLAKMDGNRELYENPLDAKDLTQHWQDLVDVLKIKQVDFQPDVAEHLLLNPEKIGGIFWENAAWTPEQGYQTFGESRRRMFGMPSRKGQSRAEIGLPPRVRATQPPPEVTGFEGPHSTIPSLPTSPSILPKVDFSSSQLKEIPGGGYFNPRPGSMEFMEQFKKDLDMLNILRADPNVKMGFAYPNLKNAAKQLHDMYLQPMPKVGKKGAIAAALGVGGLVGGTDEAQAMPIGKLKAAAKAIPNALRSEDAFYKLLGHKLNLSMQGGPRQPYEVVDVLKNHTNDWRYVIVKDAQGKRHQLPMTKDYLNVYLGAKGTQDYVEKFGMEGLQGKKIQALKSLTKRENTREATAHVNDKDFRMFNRGQMEKAREIDPALVNDYAYVKVLGNKEGQSLYMPREYANFLAQKGFVKILKH